MTTVFIAAGDASGDAHAADFAGALRSLRTDVRFVGLGGDALEAAGAALSVHQRELAVGGLVELLPHLPRIAGVWRRLTTQLRSARPDLVVLVDSAGLNLRLARRARRLGVPVLYYVAPQVWAWRRYRLRALARRVDRVALILPFEVPLYEHAGVRADFVGHPLVDRVAGADLDRVRAREALDFEARDRLVALLPGSRRNELRHCLPLLLETARILHARDVRVRFALPVAPSLDRDAVEAAVRRSRLPSMLRLSLFGGRALEVLAASDVAVVKPGTATLEATLLGCPLVIAARTQALSAAVLRRLVAVDSLGMPNLIAGEPIVPEFLQQDAEPERIADAVVGLFAGPAREAQLARLAEVRKTLRGGAAGRAARIAQEMIGARGGA